MSWHELLEVFRRPLFPLGQTDVTLALLFQLVLVLVLVAWGSSLLRRLVFVRVLRRTNLDPGQQDAVAKIVGYLLLGIGLLVGLGTIGIELTSLTVIAGALGVGIGFGLQNIVENFVSGLIIMAERPIRLGDRVEVGGTAGQVVAIGARSTTVRTNDNVVIIIPNSEFVTSRVINWSHAGDRRIRFRIPIGVGYRSDPREVERLLLAVVRANPTVLAEPAPRVLFKALGDSALEFEMRVWTSELHDRPGVLQSDLYYAAWEALKAGGVEIPFPQRDLHVREPVRVEIAR